jgi:hypothetical protein
MAIKTYAVRIGNRYGIQYEEALKEKLDIEFLHEEKEEFKLQWNKLHFFNLDIDEAICVIDIDIKLINDYQKLFEYPIEVNFLQLNLGGIRDLLMVDSISSILQTQNLYMKSLRKIENTGKSILLKTEESLDQLMVKKILFTI